MSKKERKWADSSAKLSSVLAEYLINNEVVRIEKGYITLFWACTPHQLTRPGDCQQMAIFNLPMHLFLSWPLDRELINHVTHGMVIKSLAAQQLSAFEVRRWQQELSHENEQIRQLAIDEIALMLKRLSLAGWQPILVNKTSRTHKNSVSRHAQFYVSQMLEFIAAHYDQALTVNAVAEHVKLNPNYAMGVFQRVMQQTMKQYITAMRINHATVLPADRRSPDRYLRFFARCYRSARQGFLSLPGYPTPPGSPLSADG